MDFMEFSPEWLLIQSNALSLSFIIKMVIYINPDFLVRFYQHQVRKLERYFWLFTRHRRCKV